MTDLSRGTMQLQECMERLFEGDEGARQDLVRCACERLQRLTRKMLRDFPGVRRWEETDDVFQNAVLRLCRALEHVSPQSVPDFVRLASLQIRRELIDLARHYFGPEGLGANYASQANGNGSVTTVSPGVDAADPTHDQEKLARWTAFHHQVQSLPDDEREIFDLLWYQGMSQAEAALLLNVTERTVQRRWQHARLSVHRAMKGDFPGS